MAQVVGCRAGDMMNKLNESEGLHMPLLVEDSQESLLAAKLQQ